MAMSVVSLMFAPSAVSVRYVLLAISVVFPMSAMSVISVWVCPRGYVCCVWMGMTYRLCVVYWIRGCVGRCDVCYLCYVGSVCMGISLRP